MADSKISDLVAKSTLADTDLFVIASGATNNKVLRSVMATELFRDGSNDIIIQNSTQDKDIIIRGDDGGVSIDPLTFDMSGNIARFGSSTKLSTGGETAPDCESGGQTYLHAVADKGYCLTIKNAAVAHGMTSITETDTYGVIGRGNSNGVMTLRGFGEGDFGVLVKGYGVTEDTSDDTSSFGSVTIDGLLKSGTSAGDLGVTGNIFAVRNNLTTRLVLKGNGTMHITNTTLVALDEHNDIELLNTSRKVMEGKRKGLKKEHLKVLKDAGVFNKDLSMINQQQMQKFTMDTMIQVFNVIKGLAKKLNLTEAELFEMAKEY
jgi:hypothetical protein